MKPTTMQRLSLVLLTVIVFATSTAAVLSAWWIWGPVSADYAVLRPESHTATYRDGVVTVRRVAMTKRPMTLMVTREIRRVDVPFYSAISGPPMQLHMPAYPAGIEFERDIPLGFDLPPGRYVLQSDVTWPANPLRDVTTRTPPLEFTVPAS